MATVPVVLKISAEKDAAVNTSLKALQADATKVQGAFAKVAGESEALLQSLAKLRQEAEKSGQGFSKGGKESSAALSETTKAAKEAAEAVRKGEEAKAAARQKARKNLEYALREEEKYRVATVSASKAAADAAKKSADEQAAALSRVRDEMDKNAQMSKELGSALTVGLAAAGVSLLGLAGYAVKVANEFEQMEAQLVTATGSSVAAAKAIENAQAFASKSPFDLSGVVKATVQIEVYGQRSKDILPRVGALAAGMGKRIEDTALVVGKALSGSLEGFESLRNEYGITTRELVKFGAEQNKAGGILVQTAGQADKARTALLKIIDLRYGDAVERQAKTLKGQLEKVSDEMTAFAGEVGKGAGEVVKLGAAFVGGGFELLRKIPAPIKEAAGAILILSGGMAAAGAAAITFGGGLVFLLPRLVAAQSSFVAMGGAQGALFILEQRFNALGLSAIPRVATSLFALAGPTAVIGGLAAAWGAVTLATNRYIDVQKELQAEMAESSRLFQTRIQENKDLAKAIDNLAAADARAKGLAPPESVGLGNAASDLEKIKSILDKSAASDFFTEMKKIGFGPEEARKALASVGDELELQKQTIKDLEKEREESIRKQTANSGAVGLVNGPDTRDIDARINAAKQDLELSQSRADKLELVNKKQDESIVAIDKLGKAQQRADDYLKYADKAKDLKSMNSAYGVMAQKVSVAAAKLKELNEPTDRDSLLNKLLTGSYDSNEDLKDEVKAYLDNLDSLESRSKDLQEKRQEGDRKALDELKANLSEERAARKLSLDEELGYLAEQREVALRLGEAGEKELTRITKEENAARRRDSEENLKKSKESAKAALDAAKSIPTAARASEKGTQSAVDAYDRAIKRVKDWVANNAQLIKQFPELGRQGESAIRQLQLSRAQAEVARTTKNFSDLQNTLRDLEAGAVNTTEKLAAVARAKDLTDTAEASKKITKKQADEVRGDLGRKKDSLDRTKAQEEIRYRQERLDAERQAAEQQLAIEETLTDGSIRSQDRILVARERLYQYQIQAIELEKEAAIAAGEEKVKAEERAAAKIKAIEKQKTADLHAELNKRYQDEKSRLQGIIDENQTEDALNLNTGLNFGGESDGDKKRRTRKAAEKELEAIERAEKFRKLNPEIVARTAEEERQRALRVADPTGILNAGQAGIDSAAKNATGPTTVNNNTTNTVNIYNEKATSKTARSDDEVVKIVRDEIATNQYYDPSAGIA